MKLYYRNVDAGHGRQCVLVSHGKIMEQWLEADSGHYTGSGNPEWVGQKNIGLRRRGFKPLYIPVNMDVWDFLPERVMKSFDKRA